MANRLSNIRVRKIDLVNAPAIGKTITLFKSKDKESRIVTTEELKSAIGELSAEDKQEVLKSLGIEIKDPDPLKAEDILKALEDLKPKNTDEWEGVPDVVRKSIESLGEKVEKEAKRADTAEEELAKMQAKERRAAFIAKAADLDRLPGASADDLAPILEKASEVLEKEDQEKLMEVLKGANEAIRSSDLFKEIGRGGEGVPGTAYAEMLTKAEDVRKENPDLTSEQAFAQIAKSDHTLYDRYVQEQEARKGHTED